MGEVTEYLATLEGADRAALEHVYDVARALVPDAREALSYGMPALTHAGAGFISALQAKRWLALYPFSGAVLDRVADQLTGFDRTKGALHFSAEHPVPDDVLRRIIELRVAEIDTSRATDD